MSSLAAPFCVKCNAKPVVDGRLCYLHHTEAKKAEWLDNTDRNNLGIIKWAKELIPEYVPQHTPEFHKDLYLDLLSLYNPEFKNKYERLYGLISFRGSAKSTAANTIFCAYILANNGKSFKILDSNGKVKDFTIHERAIVIISETGASAEDFTVRIRDMFSESENLRYYYKVSIKDAMDSDTGQWTRTAFRFNNTFVIGRGAGMQVRGKVKGYSRPTLIIGDDLYSETNVKTETSRASARKWWNGTVLNSVDDLNGKIVLLGTILHEDTVLVDIENNPRWKVRKIPVMGKINPLNNRSDMTTFFEFIDAHLKVNPELRTCYLPFDDIEDRERRFLLQQNYFAKVQKEKDWELAWPERLNLYLLASKYQEAIYNNTLGEYYQEYFHEVVPMEERRFRKDLFQHIPSYELKFVAGYNWIKVPGQFEDWQVCNIEFGVDLAGRGNDEMAISVVAACSNFRVYVLYQAAGHWSLRDVLENRVAMSLDTDQALRRMKVVQQESRGLVNRIGVVDEIYRLAQRFHPSSIKIGVAGEEELVREEISRVFEQNRNYTTEILSRKQTSVEGNKFERIANTLLPFYETMAVYHTPGLDQLEYQLQYLGRSKHDDRADSLECAFFSLEYPPEISYDNVESKRAQNISDAEDRAYLKKYFGQGGFSLMENFKEYI